MTQHNFDLQQRLDKSGRQHADDLKEKEKELIVEVYHHEEKVKVSNTADMHQSQQYFLTSQLGDEVHKQIEFPSFSRVIDRKVIEDQLHEREPRFPSTTCDEIKLSSDVFLIEISREDLPCPLLKLQLLLLKFH
ncbi:N-succinylarginine dihydrolase [Striga asiatica]|uniref:N-succinylarginine dihydrolase n=1 Tax=Striga asiatica TaxID=4170 RepID=A0A5A7PIL1_STRAF|nr:N-succinylarginine dihydrolase [Striga asiatica]